MGDANLAASSDAVFLRPKRFKTDLKTLQMLFTAHGVNDNQKSNTARLNQFLRMKHFTAIFIALHVKIHSTINHKNGILSMPRNQNYAANFKGFDDFIEVFKVGNHVSMNGTEISFTTADLDEMAANTPANTAPIVVGHPKTDAPAYGWGIEFKRDGEKLFAKCAQVNPTFAKWVEDGAYKKRSLSVVKGENGLRIKHIGFLGAAAPAIEGMADMQFAADDGAEAFEFGVTDAVSEIGYMFNTIGNFLRTQRDFMIASSGIEAADKYFPEYQLAGIQNAAQNLRATLQSGNNFAAADEDAAFAQAFKQVIDAKAQQAESQLAFAARESDLLAQNAALKAQLARQAHEQQVATWQADGKLTPASAVGVADFMAHLSETASFEFSVADASLTGAAWFASFIDGQKPISLGQERAGGAVVEPVDTDAVTILAAAQEFTASQAGKGITVELQDAVLHVVQSTKS